MSERKIDILLDCDGILSDFVGGVIRALNARPGCLDRYHRDQVNAWNIASCLGVDEGLIYQLAGDEEFCGSLDPLPGAQEGVKLLRKLGHNVYIVTSPIWSSKTWMHERVNWLNAHFGIRANHVIQTSAKHLVEGDLFLDDRASTVERWNEHRKGYAFLWDAPWNAKEPDHGVRIETWETVAIAARRISVMREGEYASPAELTS